MGAAIVACPTKLHHAEVGRPSHRGLQQGRLANSTDTSEHEHLAGAVRAESMTLSECASSR